MDAPSVSTFDIAEMFEGQTFPEEIVTVYMDEGVNHSFAKLLERATEALRSRDEELARQVEAEEKALKEQAESKKYVFHLRGASRDKRKAILDTLRADFPPTKGWTGQESFSPEAEEAFANRTWSLHIEKIVSPSGAINTAPSEADIALIRGKAPDAALAAIEAGIQSLTEGAKSGFEALVQEHDFLSSASPEA